MKKIFTFLLIACFFWSCNDTSETDVLTSNESDVISDEYDDASSSESNPADEDQPSQMTFNDSEYLVYGINRNFQLDTLNSVDEMYHEILNDGSVTMTVQGSCSEICQMAGCWIEVAKSDSTNVFVKFKDHFTLPIESTVGKSVVFHGTGKVDTTSIEMQRHYLDDKVKSGEVVSKEDYDAIVSPKVDITFIADGIMVQTAKGN
ncbi:MAG: DUF4920 domain-containing protein [Crocinitomicaceae bacterium]|jgi:hypothetical protein|nr:DUF4920 domain-containing protein [Crocinitomicaceae bacterium]